ncbi:hypothetical protein [Agrobacterium tumefaciens]|uniref:hypothetical protein n=1 Tax=Agrobacterium tumefaciens TaxID=358 RepID=UPI001571CA25|nr:hypothetical protein [Agrobacterium tumefaciens]WCK69313.1 hypothetical protein G6L23_026570 [Agrobacterium tumefaciens]
MKQKLEEPTLYQKMEGHIAALKAKKVTEWDDKRTVGHVSPAIYAATLAAATREEEAARLSIVMHEPADRTESDRKLEYLAAYILATRAALDPKEMEVIEAIADRLTG